jgi:hypothetical protein
MQFGLFMMPLHPPERSFADNPEWDQRSLQLLMEAVGPRLADLGRG